MPSLIAVVLCVGLVLWVVRDIAHRVLDTKQREIDSTKKNRDEAEVFLLTLEKHNRRLADLERLVGELTIFRDRML